jgi:uncharacterized repeat protein (TIGR03803 family)
MSALRVLCVSAVIVMLVACGGESGTPLSLSPAGVEGEGVHATVTYAVVHRFRGNPGDGSNPSAGLLNVGGTLYGTTSIGGKKNYGTVFVVTQSDQENVLHSFVPGGGGLLPYAALINVNGVLYGTTAEGGSSDEGTIFKITTSGKESAIYSFGTASEDGLEPTACLLNVNGMLYGTTSLGGTYNAGTVFSVTTSGKETVLYSFGKTSADGEVPQAGLTNVNGMLYGTTAEGGAYSFGTVFDITTSGKESVIHTFQNSGDGVLPYAGLINVGGTLYSTTVGGGTKEEGTIFKITTSGKEALLYSFGRRSSDGEYPYVGLLNVKGKFYGETIEGGTHSAGTVFSVTQSGKESVLYNFGTASGDGTEPRGALINVNGTLYGTTGSGGTNSNGIVFSLKP